MQAIILAAGRGTRMRPLSDTTPKPMLPVAGKPIAARVADAAIAAGADSLVFVVGYRRRVVESFFEGTYRGVPVEYAVQSERTGTADAVATAIDHVEGSFAVLNGDNVYDPASLATLFDQVPAVGYTRVSSPEEYGVISTDGDRVTGIVEKPDDPPSDLANTGAYAFPASVATALDVPPSERGERELTDVLRRLLAETTVTGVAFEEWMDVGYPDDLLAANERALADIERRIDGDVDERASVLGAVVVESGASIGPGAVVEGPTLIESDATVSPNASVKGATVVGERVTVGRLVDVEGSLLMAGATVDPLSYVGDSIVGPDATLGAGTVTNKSPDTSAGPVRTDTTNGNERLFGAVIGPGTSTDIDAALDPGEVRPADVSAGSGIQRPQLYRED
ncbi:MAG: bifunctional sugar-1-phosphate nucleotidylyltransferase/acetyltransferase [Halorhabdus sp.]